MNSESNFPPTGAVSRGRDKMKDTDEIHYHLIAQIPDEEGYLVSDIVHDIAAQKYPHECGSTCNYSEYYTNQVVKCNARVDHYARCSKTYRRRHDFASNLEKQIYRMWNIGMFNLWNKGLDQTNPPQELVYRYWHRDDGSIHIDYYSSLLIKKDYILKSDFLDVCKRERIRIIFDDDAEQTAAQIAKLKDDKFTFCKNDGSAGTMTAKAPPATSAHVTPEDSKTELESQACTPAKKQSEDDNVTKKQPDKFISEQKSPQTDEKLKDFDGRPDSSYVAIDTLAALLDCSTRTIQRLVDNGQLPKPRKIGGMTRFNVGKIKNALAQSDEI